MKNSPQPRNHFPFLAIAAVFVTLAFVKAATLKDSLKQREQLQATTAELQKVIPQALTISRTIENLGHDLLAMTNQEAKQIVVDFKIAPSPQAKK